MRDVIRVMDVCKSFGEEEVLKHVSYDFKEGLIYGIVGNNGSGKTVLMIAHRLSSITGADCIYVMQNGEIAESGTHDELIRKNGMFTHMWKNYSEAAEWKIEKEAEL